MSKQTQAHYREAISAFYEWCSSKDIVESNIAASKPTARARNYRKEVANERREAYSREDLLRIFQHEFYKNAEYAHPYQYWVPHIALFTGARINEISQLYVEDIVNPDGFHAFSFCALDSGVDAGGNKIRRGDTRQKTAACRRLTPIHPTLVDLGFLDFVKSMKDSGQKRIFPSSLTQKRVVTAPALVGGTWGNF